MITIEKRLDLPDTYPLERIGRLEELLFFDIETTGFSGDYANLYLIGCTFYRGGSWHLTQWFADRAASEEELLHAFFGFLREFRILVHFNGDGFDIPFLLKRCRHFGLPYDFSAVQSVDIYKRIKPYRRVLGLDSLKQKAIEQFLGVSRTDRYSGGQLIEVYHDYLVTHEKFLEGLLLLHNEDDLKGMPLILPILNYVDFFEHPFCLTGQRRRTERGLSGAAYPLLELTCESSYTLPVPVSASQPPVALNAEGSRLTVTLDLFEGTLKHFYPNYRDYYYLIYEDTAVHKSVGEYVDKEARTKATAKNCYVKKDGCFLPQFEPLWEPVMRREPKDKLCYAAIDDVRLDDSETLQRYLKQIFHYLGV